MAVFEFVQKFVYVRFEYEAEVYDQIMDFRLG